MGVLNVTPDSFSDGGAYSSVDAAVSRGLCMVEEGAVIVDVGGESTRPGAEEAPRDEEMRRTLPVIDALRQRSDVAISIDTRKADVAREAVRAGAGIINDVSALTHDERMAGVAAESGAGVVLMHMRGRPRTMQEDPVYEDVVAEVAAYLAGRLEVCRQAGIEWDALAIDPGIGFGKTVGQNLDLLAGIPALARLERPVLIGLSRKSFLGRLTGREVDDRVNAGVAAHTCTVLRGVHIVRTHDVKETRDAIIVAQAMKERMECWTR